MDESEGQSVDLSAFYRWAVHRKRLQSKSARDYLVWVRHADRSLGSIGVNLAKATVDDLLTYYDSLKQTAYVHNNVRSALVTLYEFLGREDNPAKELPRWKVPARIPKHIEMPEAARVVARAYEYSNFFGCLVLLYLSTGLRCSELCTRRWSDVVGNRLYYTKKGGNQGIKELNEEALIALEAWREECPSDEWIFPSPRLKDKPIGLNWVCRKIKDFGKDVGVAGLHTHRLRHTHAMQILKLSGYNILAVQESLGHAQVNNTMVYLRAEAHASREANALLRFK